ncbi:MurT ligase domain-containing protein [soil metagenome]
MKNQLIIYQGKLLSRLIKTANLGDGSTWPGHIALKQNPNFIKHILKNSKTKVIFIVGTNGKTTTSALLTHLLKADHKKVILNTSGANLINGIASALLLNTDIKGQLKIDYALFEIDENAFPQACKEVTPNAIVMLNLFRDQLDRYGEVNTIASKWSKTISQLPGSTKLYLNADDPLIASLGKDANQKVFYFGLDEKTSTRPDLISDSAYCPKCGSKLLYDKTYYSHLGIWSCPKGDLARPASVTTSAPSYILNGMYNKYNTIAAYITALHEGISHTTLSTALTTFKPAFGRQEKIEINGKKIEVILAKNPAGFNQTLHTVVALKAKNILILLNDKIADGTDVSWIWDVDFEILTNKKIAITLSGDRVYDLALRFKYAEIDFDIQISVADSIKAALKNLEPNDTLYIIPTYTAMLDVRKVLTGKKIL